MFDSLFNSTTIPLLQKVAAFTERRNEALAGNVANISTPNYKTRNLPVAEFQKALQGAVARRTDATQPSDSNWKFTSAGMESSEFFPAKLFQVAEASSRSITFQDGNNRNIESEMMEMTKNSLLQNMAIELLSAQMNRLQAVISERP